MLAIVWNCTGANQFQQNQTIRTTVNEWHAHSVLKLRGKKRIQNLTHNCLFDMWSLKSSFFSERHQPTRAFSFSIKVLRRCINCFLQQVAFALSFVKFWLLCFFDSNTSFIVFGEFTRVQQCMLRKSCLSHISDKRKLK